MDKLIPTEKSVQRAAQEKRNNPDSAQKGIYKCQRGRKKGKHIFWCKTYFELESITLRKPRRKGVTELTGLFGLSKQFRNIPISSAINK